MSEFANSIQPTTPPATVGDCRNVRSRVTEHGDEVDEHTRHLAALRSLPEVRQQRIAAIKQQIGAGTFDTDARLALALDRMFEELQHD